MEVNFLQFEKMQKYLGGEMTRQEEKLFLAEVKSNPELSQLLDFEIDLHDHFFLTEADNNFAKLGLSEDDFDIPAANNHKKNRHPIYNYPKGRMVKFSGRTSIFYLAAASVIALICVGGILFYFQGNQTKNNLSSIPNANSNAAIDSQNSENVGGKGANGYLSLNENLKIKYDSIASIFYVKDSVPKQKPAIISEQLIDFEKGDYITIQSLDISNLPLSGDSSTDMETKELAYYYKGLSYMESGSPEPATENLRWVIDSGHNIVLQQKAAWYLAINYLKGNNPQLAFPVLAGIQNSSTDSIIKGQSSALLQKLSVLSH